MSATLRILPLAISSLLMIPAPPGVQAAHPSWECRATADGQGWECLKEGERVPWEQAPAPAPAPKVTKETDVIIEPVPEPAEMPLTPVPAKAAAPRVGKPAEPTKAPEEEAAKAAAPPPAAEKPAPAPLTAPVAAEPEIKPAVQAKAEEQAPAEPALIVEQPTRPAEGRIDQGLDWSSQCDTLGQAWIAARPAARLTLTDNRIHARADSAEMLLEEDVAAFSGQVELRRGDQLVEADEVHYNNIDDVADARGNVYYQQPGLRLTGATARLQLGANQGQIEQAEYRLPDRIARGNAASAEMLDQDRSRYQDISYTTCPPGNDDWLLQAGQLDVDQASGKGLARHARLSFKGVPFLYSPIVSFPIDNRRMTGFLVPSFGQSTENGTDISIPYYLNLAPNYDATLTPRIMSKRGVMLGGEFRYLTKTHNGIAAAEILPNDKARQSEDNETRKAGLFKGQGSPFPRWSYNVDLNYISDKEYLEDFGNSLSISAARHLNRLGDLLYNGNNWSLLGRLQTFQTVDEGISSRARPYHRLPQLLLRAEQPGPLGLTYHLQGEYVQFDHDVRVEGHRFDVMPGVSLPMRNSWGYLTPKLSARYTDYSLNNRAAGDPESPSRFLPILSVDSGLIFEREVSWFGRQNVQSLEPRLFYLWIPDDDQDDLPVFDTALRDFSFASMFKENRFSGADRQGDANQLTTALTFRSIAEGRGEWLRASIGQILYFADRNVQLPRANTQDDNSSALVGELAARLTNDWTARAALEWDPHLDQHKTEHASYQLHYRDERRRILNLAYRYNKALVEQFDASARWPLLPKLYGVARWNYSWKYDRNMESLGGLEYESCCWVARALVRRYVNDIEEDANTTFLMQLELKGLTSFGDKIDTMLDRGIFGYAYGR